MVRSSNNRFSNACYFLKLLFVYCWASDKLLQISIFIFLQWGSKGFISGYNSLNYFCIVFPFPLHLTPFRLAAIALLYLEQEEAFWCLITIVEVFMPRDYYTKTLLGSQVLLKACTPTGNFFSLFSLWGIIPELLPGISWSY